jgi:hypothetical protein
MIIHAGPADVSVAGRRDLRVLISTSRGLDGIFERRAL